jgi:hypothetical protein
VPRFDGMRIAERPPQTGVEELHDARTNLRPGDEIEKLVILQAGRIAVLIIVVLIAAMIF